MKSASAKKKGRRLQLSVALTIRAAFPELQDEDVRVGVICEHGEDIHLSMKARQKVPFAIECKNQERINIWSALEQSETNAVKAHLAPCLIFKKNHGDAYATIRAVDLFKLLRGEHITPPKPKPKPKEPKQ